MNQRKKTLKEFLLMLAERGIENVTISEPSVVSLALGSRIVSSKLARSKKFTVLKTQTMSVSFRRESGLLGKLSIELILEQKGGEFQCRAKLVGGKQLELFHNTEEGVQRFAKEYEQFFKLGKAA